MNFLTGQEREQVNFQHRRERYGRIRDRIKAVLLYDKGWTLKDIARVLLISNEAGRNHINDYKASEKLKPERGRSPEKFSEDQSQKLEAHQQTYTYPYVKNIVAYVEVTFRFLYTVHGMRNWLQRDSFSYKKSAIVPGRVNKAQQQKWLSEYEKLREKLPEDETICFTACVHPTHNVPPVYGWIKKRGA